MVSAALACGEVVGAQEAVIGQGDTTSSHAVVIGMVRHRTSDTAGQTTFGAAGVGGVGDVAGQADVERAAEATALGDGGAVLQDAVHVVELPTHWDLAALHIAPRRLAHKAGVYTCSTLFTDELPFRGFSEANALEMKGPATLPLT